jgi:hypothetical protein
MSELTIRRTPFVQCDQSTADTRVMRFPLWVILRQRCCARRCLLLGRFQTFLRGARSVDGDPSLPRGSRCGSLWLAHPSFGLERTLPPSRDLHPAVGASLSGRRANRRSRRVSASLTPVKQAISISSRRMMASSPSSLSKLSGQSAPLTAAKVASKVRSKISRSSGSNLCRSDLNKCHPPQPQTALPCS